MEHLWARNNFLNTGNRTVCVIYGSKPAWVSTANDGIKGSLARQDAITALRSISGEVPRDAHSLWRLHLKFKWGLN